ncbi:translation initiation factor IF-3 [Candidatus Dojkabacteria bacterium]|nr:translation initiation factor IF-3 [Candidatus Dojkabacteria bacterium]
MVIDESNDNVGEMSTQDAISLAKERELDLVEVAPKANPPVCKLIQWSKFQYQQQKKEKKNKGKEKKLKEMRFKTGIGLPDLERKVENAKEFLEKGHAVKITLMSSRKAIKRSMDDIFADLLTYFEGYSKISDVQKGRRQIGVIFKKTQSVKSTDNNSKATNEDKTSGGKEA